MINNTQDPLWFKDAIIYELHIKAFQDSNADGIGDFNGLIERLDYLEDLGVTAIWLLPFYPSPQRDGGYDISDYYSINPDYGTLKQLKKVMKLAHQRGLKVITELVINHTSDQHPWFQRARQSPPGSVYRDYYVWTEDTNKYKDVRIIFQDFEVSNWTWDPVAQAYYWHRFYSHQPDLNFDSLAVQEEIFKIIDFWVELGVDGFRLDAIPYLFERDGTNCENLPETHVFLKKLRAHVDRKNQGVLLLAEANMWPEDSAAYFGDGDECHMNYHFPIMPRMFMSIKMEDRYPIIDIIDQTPEIPENCQWGIFLRNHDELTLEMVTDEERDYMYRAYNKNTYSRINLGIRHRLAPLLDNHRQKMELMNCLLFSLPGTPVVYYGDEIGMGDNVHLGDRDGVRTPMQWSIDRNAGFSRAHPHKLYLPLISDPEYHYEQVNVEVQQNSPASLLWWMKRMINVRKKYQAFGRGNIIFLSPENSKVLAFTRSYQDQHLLVLANLSRHPQAVELELPEFERYIPVEVFGQTPFPVIEHGHNRFTLGPYGYYWFLLKPETQFGQVDNGPARIEWAPQEWQELGKAQGLALLAKKILPAHLARNDRFVHGTMVLDRLEVLEAPRVQYPGGVVLMLILKADFTEGFPEYYFLPLAFADGDPGKDADAPSQDYIVAILESGKETGYLFEATESPQFQQAILRNLLNKDSRTMSGFRFVRPGRAAIKKSQSTPIENLTGRKVKTSGTNLSLAFGNQYYLKIFRRLEHNLNPELEINEYAGLKNLPVPGYLGHLERNGGNGIPFVLAILQPYRESQGSAWQYFLDTAKRYLERVETQPVEQRPEFPAITSGGSIRQTWEPLIDSMAGERANLLGQTVARLHLGLIDHANPDLQPEAFSLHYQRSLFSALKSQVRRSFGRLKTQGDFLVDAEKLLDRREEILERFRRIYDHKINADKIRIHGDLHLEKIFFTGKEFYLFDFEGEHVRSFSELRLKKSPIRDLASLLCSFYYVALFAVQSSYKTVEIRDSEMLPWAEAWAEVMSNAFLKGYLPLVKDAGIIPEDESDWHLLLQTFMLERHLYELEFELVVNRQIAAIPLLGILRRLEEDKVKAE